MLTFFALFFLVWHGCKISLGIRKNNFQAETSEGSFEAQGRNKNFHSWPDSLHGSRRCKVKNGVNRNTPYELPTENRGSINSRRNGRWDIPPTESDKTEETTASTEEDSAENTWHEMSERHSKLQKIQVEIYTEKCVVSISETTGDSIVTEVGDVEG